MLDFKEVIKEEHEKLGVYLNLDSLIDTRLSLLYSVNKGLFNRTVKKLDEYQSRYTDEFEFLDNEHFKYLYKKRDKSVIKEPIPTYIPSLIKDYVMACFQTKPSIRVKIFLNVFPYVLSKTEEDALSKNITAIYGNIVDVEIMNVSEDMINIKFVYDNLAMMIMYNGLEWIENRLADKSLDSLPLPEVMMIVPRLLDRKIIEDRVINEFFHDYEKMLNPFIRLLFLTPRIFSIKINSKK